MTLKAAFGYLTYLYLMRFQLLTLAALLLLPVVALHTRARALFGGMFDLDTAGPMFFLSLAAFATAWTVMETLTLVAAHAPARFGVPALPHIFHRDWLRVATFSFAAVWLLWGVYHESTWNEKSLRAPLAGWAVAGFVAAILVLFAARLEVPSYQHWAPIRALANWLSGRAGLGQGYVRMGIAGPELLSGHVRALATSILLFAIYAVVGFLCRPEGGHSLGVTTLGYVLIILMLLCLGLSGAAFFLDRFRFPVLSILFLIFLVTATSSHSDNYFDVLDSRREGTLAPFRVIRARGRKSAIVVAANGGGIQAAAWTAQVLAGLETRSRAEIKDRAQGFAKAVRFISSVSGGSVGAMYFVNAYRPEGIPDGASLTNVVDRAMHSSLEEVAWGLAYPDLWRPFLPWFVPRTRDRGTALETAWSRDDNGLTGPLGGWREGVREGWRPASVFNATISDTGERLLFATTDLTRVRFGRKSFYELEHCAGRDIRVVTAARLSATFPFVTPAARPDVPGAGPHVVDGGYYDNYGISTLVEWLDEALDLPDNPIERVLVIEIRGAPRNEPAARGSDRGWFYQAFAPVATMLHVRDTGQFAHNEVEFGFLRRVPFPNKTKVESVVFEYRPPANRRGAESGPPLSWHLTEEQKQDIREAWKNELARGDGWTRVKAFLEGGE